MNVKKLGLAILVAGLVLTCACGKKTASEDKNETSVSVSVSSKTSASGKTSVSVPEEQEEETDTTESLEVITFGRFEQDGNPDNGSEPIEWIVLTSEGDRQLLISKYVLDCKPFNKGFAESDWENSSVRKYLNGDFMKAAFSSEEAGKILETLVPSVEPDSYRETKIAEIKAARAATEDPSDDNEPIPEIEIPGTKDKVFLFSDFEVKKYLSDNPDIKGDEPYARATNYAASQGVWILTEEYYKLLGYTDKYPMGCIGCAWWWLRTNPEVLTKAQDVDTTGDIRVNGHDTGESHDGIRPAIWISK